MKLNKLNGGRIPKPIRILVVDDSAVFRQTTSSFLKSLPHLEEIGAAATGSEAMKLVSRHRPDVVLLDLQMPDISGLETMERIRPLNPITRVVMLTMHDGEIVRAACLVRGADGFVSKNRMREELPAVMRRLFAEQFADAPAEAVTTKR